MEPTIPPSLDPQRAAASPLDALSEHLRGLTGQAEALRSDVHAAEAARRRAEAARRRANRINLGVLAVVALLVAAMLVIGYQNNQLAQEVSRTNEQVADCTTPGRRCYEEGRARTNGAVAAVVRISVFVSQCGRLYPGESGPEYDRKLERCVAEKLAAAQPSPSAPVQPR